MGKECAGLGREDCLGRADSLGERARMGCAVLIYAGLGCAVLQHWLSWLAGEHEEHVSKSSTCLEAWKKQRGREGMGVQERVSLRALGGPST